MQQRGYGRRVAPKRKNLVGPYISDCPICGSRRRQLHRRRRTTDVASSAATARTPDARTRTYDEAPNRRSTSTRWRRSVDSADREQSSQALSVEEVSGEEASNRQLSALVLSSRCGPCCCFRLPAQRGASAADCWFPWKAPVPTATTTGYRFARKGAQRVRPVHASGSASWWDAGSGVLDDREDLSL